MEWYKNSNSSADMPSAIDRTSSHVYDYVRKGFILIEASASGEGDDMEIPAHYEWLEMKVPKEIWEIYAKTVDHDAALDDVYAALTELADIIVEG